MKCANDVLRECADLFDTRSIQYPRNNWEIVGNIMNILVPEGIELKTENDHERYHIFTWLIGKICRYSQNYNNGGHEDSLKDAIVYAAILKSIDEKINEVPF